MKKKTYLIKPGPTGFAGKPVGHGRRDKVILK